LGRPLDEGSPISGSCEDVPGGMDEPLAGRAGAVSGNREIVILPVGP